MSEQEVQEVEVPEILEVGADDLGYTERSYPVLKPAVWMLMEVLSGKKVGAKTGTLMKDWLASPVDEDGKVLKKGKAKLRLILPIAHKNFINPKTGKQHEAPNTVFGCYMTLRAFDSDFPHYATKVDGRPGMYEMPDGTIVNQEEAFFYNGGTRTRPNPDSVDAQVKKAAVALYNEDNSLVGERVYGYIEHEVGDDGRIWAKVTKTRATPPDDEPVITSNFFVGQEADEEVPF